MTPNSILYNSAEKKSEEAALRYCKTAQSLYRYLAYRDLPALISKNTKGNVAIDYGAGTGFSTQFIANQGFDVCGLEVCEEMFKQAKENFPHLNFSLLKDGTIPFPSESIDFVFSSFVLFEIGDRAEMNNYLKEASRVLKKNGIFIAVTGNEELYQRDWLCLQVNYPENKALKSGDKAKLSLPEEGLEFIDFFWNLTDYDYFFKNAKLTLLERIFPLGQANEPYEWKDERTHAPYVIFIASK